MGAFASTTAQRTEAGRVWELAWLTPTRCRWILAAVLLFGLAGHLHYLLNDCPIDLAGDEAHYWDWSRQLDLNYYSKGPLVAYIIRASCEVLGTSMPAVRFPALLLGVGTSLLTYWLARMLFASERLALGAVLLNHLVPMFVAGSVMMTIDPPFFFCWALASCLAAKAIFHGRPGAFLGMGLAIGVGFLAKYTMFLWLIGLLLFCALEPRARRHLRRPWLWAGVGLALLFTLPVLLWNHQHGWVSFRHVVRQTGTSGGSFAPGNVAEFFGGQIGALGPGLVVIMLGAILYALGPKPWLALARVSAWPARRRLALRMATSPFFRPDAVSETTEVTAFPQPPEIDDPSASIRPALRFLLCMGLPFWAIVGLWSVRTKIQVNWPAPAYFSLMILSAYFLATRLASPSAWRAWRPWFWGSLLLGLLSVPILHNLEILYRPLHRLGLAPRRWDPTRKLRGWNELGAFVSAHLRTLRPGAFVLCEKYDFTAQMAFYVEGRPKTYCVGAWFADPQRRTRHSQYDLWPDRSLDQPQLLGQDAVFVGYEPPADLLAAFDRVEKTPPFDVVRRGLTVRTFNVWRCYGFKGMKRPSDRGTY